MVQKGEETVGMDLLHEQSHSNQHDLPCLYSINFVYLHICERIDSIILQVLTQSCTPKVYWNSYRKFEFDDTNTDPASFCDDIRFGLRTEADPNTINCDVVNPRDKRD
ncbi:uncharacterized protein BCR38DRAFT_412285 [Pseudomassariella vexata]|uniref:Uncharacterized protein n=1 Tax=Pseudomassariella vexata TaxID=1141098 RepID=A0A1Y2DLP8_9PEZI|nr:uncharacterized protein BCR38DRAFT_412285 [Pseudomassariella vexata]ORY60084.1 hypothetical protein BCR38DRAFT_412285 [Pseudomassariella vexata]